MRPVKFGMAALYRYEEATGRSAISDFAKQIDGSYSLLTVVDLVCAGLDCGYLSTGKQAAPYSKYDVADWLTESDQIERIMSMFVESLPKAKNAIPLNQTKAKKKA